MHEYPTAEMQSAAIGAIFNTPDHDICNDEIYDVAQPERT